MSLISLASFELRPQTEWVSNRSETQTGLWPQLHTTLDSSHTGFLFAWDRGSSYTKPRQSGVTPLRFRGVKPFRFGSEMKILPIYSAPHSISCNCTNPMWSHSSWASQLSKTIDLDIAVQVHSVSCNCNENSANSTRPIRCEKQSGIVCSPGPRLLISGHSDSILPTRDKIC